jgi:hypothetical protein
MDKLVEVTLKGGKKVSVLSSEVPGLEKANLLQKEEKEKANTKEEKDTENTKEEKISSPITTKNVKGRTSKKT